MPSKSDGGEARENGAAGSGADKDEGGGKAEEEAEGGAKDVKASVAGVVQALTELVSVQTPASVWLPNKHLTLQHSGKVWPPPCLSIDSDCLFDCCFGFWLLGILQSLQACIGIEYHWHVKTAKCLKQFPEVAVKVQATLQHAVLS